jgi:hypothetical protein
LLGQIAMINFYDVTDVRGNKILPTLIDGAWSTAVHQEKALTDASRTMLLTNEW